MTVRIIKGDVREKLAELPADHFDCIVTSPPYFGLRSYLPDGHPLKHFEIGLEPTLGAYLETIVAVCRELRRVLKPSGIMFLIWGDSYAGGVTGRNDMNESDLARRAAEYGTGRGPGAGPRDTNRKRRNIPLGLKPKDLCLVPERLGIALQEPWYAGEIKNVTDRIWLAAMIDAEGCLYIHKRKAGTSAYSKYRNADGVNVEYLRTKDSFAIGLEIANTSREIVQKCVEITGKGSVSAQGPNENKRRRQVIYRWHLRCDECRDLIQEIYPHLVAKQHQARIGFGCPSSGAKADEAHRALMALHNGISTDCDFPPPPSLHSLGWYIRSQIKWIKKNPMPESCADRPTSAHETIWMLTKSARYFWDAEAVAEESAESTRNDNRIGTERIANFERSAVDYGVGTSASRRMARNAIGNKTNRNLRNVWSFASHPYPGAHFATFPPELAERCIKAGSSERGCCPACGAPWVRVTDGATYYNGDDGERTRKGSLIGNGHGGSGRGPKDNLGASIAKTIGWQPSCKCSADRGLSPGVHMAPIPARILDPFAGAGTTGLVADRLGRDCTLIDLNTEYAEMALNRIKDDCPMFAEVAGE